MNLTKGEYTQFSQKGKLNLLNEFGILITEKYINEFKIKIYKLYDFYVEVMYSQERIVYVEPVLSISMLKHFLT
jgi:hypothetical protein